MFLFPDLTNDLRAYMISEVNLDVKCRKLTSCPGLTFVGLLEYPSMLRQACGSHDLEWFKNKLCQPDVLNIIVQNQYRDRSFNVPIISVVAANQFAEQEFHRFYCRGLCDLVLKNDGGAVLEVYQARQSIKMPPEIDCRIGNRLKANHLLGALRRSSSVDGALGIDSGLDSGLSLRLNGKNGK